MSKRGSPVRSVVPYLANPILRAAKPFVIGATGNWLIASDFHFPFHDRTTIELALKLAKERDVRGILLNGDIHDYHELSRWDKSPDDPRYVLEVRMVRNFLAYLRKRFPSRKTRVVWRDGNHEERLLHYLASKAPALFGLDVLEIPNLLHFKELGVEYVSDRRVIRMGHLNVIHGHEYRPAIQAPVNPARGLFLRAKSSVLTGHFHQVSEHHEPDILGKQRGAWSVGCCCQLNPYYMPLNRWCAGFAFVEIMRDGRFSVENLRVIDGKVV